MIKIFRNVLFILLVLLSFTSLAIIDVDFDHSNGFDLMKQYKATYYEDPDADFKIELLRKNYERLKPSLVQSRTKPMIPKMIHQIWLGNSDMPKNYQYYLETWRQYHPHWKIKIWTEQDLVKENFPTMDLYWKARSYQERADIMRYEILNRYGGLYIDSDIECFASFDELHHKYDFYTNLEPPAVSKKRLIILNAMVASVPNHPILLDSLEYIRNDWNKVEDNFERQYSNRSSRFQRSTHNLAVLRTMLPLSHAIFSFLENTDQTNYYSIILPAGYNVPIYFVNDKPIINFLSRIFRNRGKLTDKIEFRPETMSFHYYDKVNSLMSRGNFAADLLGQKTFKGLIYTFLHRKDKVFLSFRALFDSNFPTDISYMPNSIIPKNIYLFVEDGYSQIKLEKLKEEWKKLNYGFVIKVVDDKALDNLIPKQFSSQNIKVKRLLAKCYLLQTYGGITINTNFIPINLGEFQHKYNFYGAFSTLNKINDKVAINTDIIASGPDHAIIRNLNLHVEEQIVQNRTIDLPVLEQMFIDNIYRYNKVDGPNIIFPEMYYKAKQR